MNHLPHNHSANQLRKSLRLGSSQSLSFSPLSLYYPPRGTQSQFSCHWCRHQQMESQRGSWWRHMITDKMISPFPSRTVETRWNKEVADTPCLSSETAKLLKWRTFGTWSFRISLEGIDLYANIVRRLSHVWVFRCCSWESRGWQPLSVILWRERPIAMLGLPQQLPINESNYEKP